MTGIECGHRFCTNCWTEYLTTKIIDEGMGQTISCAAHSCSILVDDHTVMRLIVDAKVKLKYQHLITKSFVEVSMVFLWFYGLIPLRYVYLSVPYTTEYSLLGGFVIS